MTFLCWHFFIRNSSFCIVRCRNIIRNIIFCWHFAGSDRSLVHSDSFSQNVVILTVNLNFSNLFTSKNIFSRMELGTEAQDWWVTWSMIEFVDWPERFETFLRAKEASVGNTHLDACWALQCWWFGAFWWRASFNIFWFIVHCALFILIGVFYGFLLSSSLSLRLFRLSFVSCFHRFAEVIDLDKFI